MDLIDRYLHVVRSCLRSANPDDVIRELSDDIRSQVEDREAELGRPLTEDEQGEVLKRRGHPLVLASRYGPQRHLIGPCVFPIYWHVLRIALGIALFVHVVNALVLIALGRPPGDALAGLAELPLGPLMVVFGWVTLVFAILDRNLPRIPFVAGWDPKHLPKVPGPRHAPSVAAQIGEFIGITAFTAWLAAVPHNQWLLFGPAAALIELSSGAVRLHLPILVLYLANVVALGIWLLRPSWARHRPKLRIASHVLALLVIGLLLNEGDLVVARQTGPAKLAVLLSGFARAGLIAAAMVVVFGMARDVVRFCTAGRARVYSSF